MTMPALRIDHLVKTLAGPVPVSLVRDISLSIDKGEFVALTGPSGSGKSSLLYLLGLLDHPSEGKIFIDGQDVSDISDTEAARLRLERIGFVFQFHFLLPEFTVLDNVLIPARKLARLPRDQQMARAHDLLDHLGLSDHKTKRPDQLSGGQRQRVAIARALINDPAVILADEPTGNLDTKSARTVFEIFRSLAHDEGRTILVVTHDQELAKLTDRRIRLVDGKIVEDDKNQP